MQYLEGVYRYLYLFLNQKRERKRKEKNAHKHNPDCTACNYVDVPALHVGGEGARSKCRYIVKL